MKKKNMLTGKAAFANKPWPVVTARDDNLSM